MTRAPLSPSLDAGSLRESFAAAMASPERFGERFYQRLFELAPALRSLFPAELEAQQQKLLQALAMLMRSLDSPAELAPALRGLGARHAGYGVSPLHYVLVGETLLETIAELSPEPLDPAQRAAWVRLYGWVAAMMLEGAQETNEDAAATSTAGG